jgi:hypothetical protein
MKDFSRNDLNALMKAPGGLCVSIYQTTHRPAAHTEQDRIRFKNLLAQAEKALIQRGLRSPAARELLAPGQALLDDGQFWQHQRDGLAVFAAHGIFHSYRLPWSFDELVVVCERFHVKPLLPLLAGNGVFFVLALSQDNVQLFRATRFGIEEVKLAGLPNNIAEALRYDDPEKQLQFHTRAPARQGERAAMFHGHGQAHGEDPKDRILHYFRALDAGLSDLLHGERAPLVLAGAEYYFPIYRQANTYPNLLEGGIPGSPERQRPDELHRQAWEIVQPRFNVLHRDALDRYQMMKGTGRTSDAIEEILPAAKQGRVDTLFVSPEVQLWGTFDSEQGETRVHDAAKVGDDDLTDLAVLHTLSNSGQVLPIEQSDMPAGSPLAAVFRY